MPKLKTSAKVENLRKMQQDLATQLKEAETKQRAEEKENQRRKHELAGAVAVKELEANPASAFAIAFYDLLNKGLARSKDREHFGLRPVAKADGGGSDVGNG